MAKFDKTKDYGEICGSHDGSRYLQGGIYFDAQGNEIAGSKTKKQVASKPVEAVSGEPESLNDDQITANLEGDSGLEGN